MIVRGLVVIAGVVLLAGGGAAGWFLSEETRETITSTETTTSTSTATETEEVAVGLPEPVAETFAQLLEAAESGDYAQLEPLIPTTGFEYTFGGPVEGGPIAYWQELERSTVERPIENLEAVLKIPYTLSNGIYVWPFAYDVADVSELSAHERVLLSPLGPLDTLFVEGTGYLGWRAGIDPQGNWVFFVAGD
jgi:hypothetical protein